MMLSLIIEDHNNIVPQKFNFISSGIVPKLIGEVITVWISNLLAQLINKYLVEDKVSVIICTSLQQEI